MRRAEPGDAGAIGAIHDEAVRTGNATFRTEPRPLAAVRALIEGELPFLVAVRGDDPEPGKVAGWAATGPYEESNPYYAGVGEAAVYISSDSRGEGAGRLLLDELATASAAGGMFKLVAKVFATNEPSLRLFRSAGYEAIGTHLRHGSLRGEWKDVVVFEKFLGESAS